MEALLFYCLEPGLNRNAYRELNLAVSRSYREDRT
jgi:hypothetical protein